MFRQQTKPRGGRPTQLQIHLEVAEVPLGGRENSFATAKELSVTTKPVGDSCYTFPMPELNAPKRQPLPVLWYTLVAPLALSLLVLALGLFASTLSTIGAGLAAAALVAALIAFLLILSYPVVYYLLFSYEVTQTSLTVKSGILFRQYETIPFDRMQVVDNERGPLLMIFGLTMIRMWTSSPDQFNIDTDNGTASSHAEPDATLIIGKNDAETLKAYMTRPKSV
jgi:uncharacterized protein